MDQPTEDEVLAARTPAALFGDAAHELASLKRAYAALVRRFRPESSPAVFAHVHALFTAARETLDGDLEPLWGQAVPVAVLPEGPAAREALAAWVDALRASRPRDAGTWVVGWSLLVRAGWSDTAAEEDALLDLLADATLSGPEDVVARLEALCRARVVWAAAARDAEVPRPLLDGIASVWLRGPTDGVRGLAKLAGTLSLPEVMRLQPHLDRHHPGVVAMLYALLVRVSRCRDAAAAGHTLSSDPPSPGSVSLLRAALGRPEAEEEPRSLRPRPSLAYIAGILALGLFVGFVGTFGVRAIAGVPMLALLVVVAALAMLNLRDSRAAPGGVLWFPMARPNAATQATIARFAGEQGLFAPEVVHLLCTFEPVSLGAGGAVAPGHAAWAVPLGELAQIARIGPAHVARVDARELRRRAEGG